MKVREMEIGKVKPYPNNPRINDKAVQGVADSIQAFGWQQPIVVDKDNVVIVGHTRLKAAELLGMDKVPVVVADELTPDEAAAYRLADNKTAEASIWDDEKLKLELGNIEMDMEPFGFSMSAPSDYERYTRKVSAPLYEIVGEEPALGELYDDSRARKLASEIMEADVQEDVREFLLLAAQRHVVFNYRKIAEFYAHQGEEAQRLMEASALVIIDFEDAIRLGYVKLTEDLQRILEDDSKQ